MRSGLKEILRSRSLWTLGCIALLYIMVQQSLLVYLALYLNDVVLAPSIPDEPTRILAAGGYLALCQFGGVFGRVFWGMVADRAFRRRRIAVLAIVGAMAAGLSVAIGLLASCQSQWLLVVVLIAAGVSVVGWNGVYHTVLTETAGQKYAGTAVGFGLTLVEAGTTMGPPIFGLILDLSGSYQVGWYFLAFLSAVGSLIALLAARVVEGPKAGTRQL
jgi:MFS family permease